MHAFGHQNISAKHRNTLELTTEDFVTKTGDCILGINFSFNKQEIKKILKQNKIKITLSAGSIKEELTAYPNPSFSSFHEYVIRKTDFVCNRTFAIKSNKACIDLKDSFRKKLANPKQKISILIQPVKIKAVIFDFDSTLEKWEKPQESIEERISVYAAKKYNISKQLFYTSFHDVRRHFEKIHTKPLHLDRIVWYKETLKKLNLKLPEKEAILLSKMYWDLIIKQIKLFPEIKEMLAQLKGKYKLAILSNSDGTKAIKMRKVNKLRLKPYFNLIATSDDVNINKPDLKPFLYTVKKLKIKPEECVMVGDHPDSDLIPAKKLGMTTVLVRRSRWSSKNKYQHVDFDLKTLKTLPKILTRLSK